MIEKQAFYRTLNQQAQALLEGEPDLIANLANLSALLNQELADINWVGFYLLQGETLVLGPFQGKPACVRIPVGRGVCGTAVAEGKTQLAAQDFLSQAALAVEGHALELGGILLYPPVPTAVQRVANIERAQMLIESENRAGLLRLLSSATETWLSLAQKNRPNGLIRWAVDVDPLAI